MSQPFLKVSGTEKRYKSKRKRKAYPKARLAPLTARLSFTTLVYLYGVKNKDCVRPFILPPHTV